MNKRRSKNSNNPSGNSRERIIKQTLRKMMLENKSKVKSNQAQDKSKFRSDIPKSKTVLK